MGALCGGWLSFFDFSPPLSAKETLIFLPRRYFPFCSATALCAYSLLLKWTKPKPFGTLVIGSTCIFEKHTLGYFDLKNYMRVVCVVARSKPET